jgi:hypothetical protein
MPGAGEAQLAEDVGAARAFVLCLQPGLVSPAFARPHEDDLAFPARTLVTT